IQATIAYIQTTSKLWILKIEDLDNSFYYNMAPKLDFAKYEIKMIEYEEDYLTVEYKSIESKVIKDYAGFMVLTYFKNLAKVLKHPDIPNIVMAYLLSLNISDWNPQDIPTTKMKTDIIIFYIPEIVTSSEPEKKITEPLTTNHIKKNKEKQSFDVSHYILLASITNTIQDLFDSISNESLVASSSKSTDISMTLEIKHIELSDDKSKSSEISLDLSVNNTVNNKLKTSNKVSSQQILYLLRYQTREQQEI
ncbi:13262_t:CDS:2, partial [Cetraspora pellucida]